MRGKLNRLARRTKVYSKADGMLTFVGCVSVAEVGVDLTYLHVLRILAALANGGQLGLTRAVAVLE